MEDSLYQQPEGDIPPKEDSLGRRIVAKTSTFGLNHVVRRSCLRETPSK